MDEPLRVSLFKWVPNLHRTHVIVREQWARLQPRVPIQFVDWDAYEEDPTQELDVFEYSAVFMQRFHKLGFLARLEVDELEDPNDILPFALKGSMVDGSLFGIPRLACTSVLFYRASDRQLEDAHSIEEIFHTIGESVAARPRPLPNQGLLINLLGQTTAAFFYLDAVADLDAEYLENSVLPTSANLRSDAIWNLRLLTRMAGHTQALHEDRRGVRARWYGRGLGRAFVGWTERLAAIPRKRQSGIRVKSLPLASANTVNFFFVDTISISANLYGEKRNLAIQLANLCAGKRAVVKSLLPSKDIDSPAYLLPVRTSVLKDPLLRAQAPLYNDLENLITKRPKALRVGHNVREWLGATKEEIHRAVTN